MTLILKQSTSIDIRMGPFVDATDGVTPETGVSLGSADQAEVLKANGASTVAMGGTFAAVSGADGWYDYTVASGDVDAVGEVVFVVQDSSVCLPVFVRAQVVEENVYVAWYAASAAAGTDLASILTDTGTTLDGKLDTIDNFLDTEIAAITAAVITNAAGSDIAADIIAIKAETATIVTDTGTTLQNELDAIQAAVITNAAGADIAADIIAIKAETATIVADTNELQSDDLPGSLSTLSGKVDTIDDFLDTEIAAITTAVITAAAGANIAADIIALKAETALILADTGTTLDGKLDTIITDTGTTLDGKINDILTDTGTTLDTKLNTIITDTGTTLDDKLNTIDGIVDDIIIDTADIQTRLPAALSSGNMKADVLAISTSTAAANNLEESTEVILSGTASGTPTTTAMVSNIGVTVNDQFVGRTIIFKNDTSTAALQNQATDITACTASSNTLTFTALTTAPASGDTFVIV
jgi:hypothetical protein